MNYSEIAHRLEMAGIENPKFEARLLISHFFGVPASSIIASDTDYASPELFDALHRREARYPLQYILGKWDFCTESYSVGPGCLIPRPETESVVLLAAEMLPPGATFLDLCTGSGCIAISLLRRRPDLRGIAVDVSRDALAYAGLNARENGVADRIKFIEGDITDKKLPAALLGEAGRVAAVLSNPPYIPTSELAGLEPELAFEPRAALDGGDDGLVFYSALIENFSDRVERFMLFETGAGQARDIEKIAARRGLSCEIKYDLAGHDRNVILRKEIDV